MKRFFFPLRSVAVLRAHAELRAREAFAAAVQDFVAASLRHDECRTHLATLAEVLFAARHGRFEAAGAAAQFRAYRTECAEAQTVATSLQEARTEMDRRREAYLEAHRELKLMERLETRAGSVHHTAAGHALQGYLDHQAGHRAGRLRLHP